MAEDTGIGGTDANPQSAFSYIDPADAIRATGGSDNNNGDTGGTSNNNGDQPRRRGRKPGSRNKPASEKAVSTALDSIGLEEAIITIHSFIALWTNMPQWALEQSEAAELKKAVKIVAKHHKIPITDKQVDYFSVFVILFTVYGSRIMSTIMDKKAAPQTETAKVVPFAVPQGSM